MGEVKIIEIPDVQNQTDYRDIDIDQVGVRHLRYPIIVMDPKNKYQHTVADVSMYVDLPRHFRGTHMSRFIEVLNECKGNISITNLESICDRLKQVLNATSAHVIFEFPYFVEKRAPVSGSKSYSSYDVKFIANKNDRFDFIMVVKTNISLLCPCSKEISKHGAHNQRATVTIAVRMQKLVWIEEIIDIAELSASAPLYTLLKREDEKYITEKAYETPRFVEDVIREVSLKLDGDDRIYWYKVEVVSYESIHNHNAYACIKKDKREGQKDNKC